MLNIYILSFTAGLTTDFHTPCILFTGHPSLRMGDIVHFIELWGNSSANTIIFTGNCFQNMKNYVKILHYAKVEYGKRKNIKPDGCIVDIDSRMKRQQVMIFFFFSSL